MSNDEETPLRDLVAQSLTTSGVLPRIKAELRASVFHALESNPAVSENLNLNKELSAFSKTEKGSIVLNLIREFLQFFNLEFTLSVFEPESCCGSSYYELSREDLLKKCKISDNKMPVLCDLINVDGPSINADLNVNKHVDSPLGLNSTYTKAEFSLDSSPVCLGVEEKVASLTPSEGSSDVPLKSPEKQASPENSERSGLSTPPNDVQNESLNLLCFTPVHEVKAVPKKQPDKHTSVNDTRDNISLKPRPKPEGKSDNIIQEKKTTALISKEEIENKVPGKISTSSLSDLPPLAGFGNSTVLSLKDLPPLGVGNKQKNVKDIKGLMEGIQSITEELNSLSSKNSKGDENGRPDSADSQRTITSEEVDEDISELLNSHPSSDGGLTADETISRLSNHTSVDYAESV